MAVVGGLVWMVDGEMQSLLSASSADRLAHPLTHALVVHAYAHAAAHRKRHRL